MDIRLFIPPIVSIIYKKFKAKKVESSYKIGNYEMEIPANYDLPKFQKAWKLYDHFLPVLVKHINSDKIIIDVGANIGDTAIALLQKCQNPMICIEPSDSFYDLLEKNLKGLLGKDFSRVTLVKSLIGTGNITGVLEHTKGGTAKIKVGESSNSVKPVALDSLVSDPSQVQLIKVDTDGYDFDVLKSADKIMSQAEPVLYWENALFEDFQVTGYSELYTLLQQKGYKHIWIFDNFGNLISKETDFETLKNINSYLYTMDKYKCTRSFYYTDILATTEKNRSSVEKAIEEYRKEWINKLR
jgi:FkbM family methyltransferase